jgi:hypothetical protein
MGTDNGYALPVPIGSALDSYDASAFGNNGRPSEEQIAHFAACLLDVGQRASRKIIERCDSNNNNTSEDEMQHTGSSSDNSSEAGLDSQSKFNTTGFTSMLQTDRVTDPSVVGKATLTSDNKSNNDNDVDVDGNNYNMNTIIKIGSLPSLGSNEDRMLNGGFFPWLSKHANKIYKDHLTDGHVITNKCSLLSNMLPSNVYRNYTMKGGYLASLNDKMIDDGQGDDNGCKLCREYFSLCIEVGRQASYDGPIMLNGSSDIENGETAMNSDSNDNDNSNRHKIGNVTPIERILLSLIILDNGSGQLLGQAMACYKNRVDHCLDDIRAWLAIGAVYGSLLFGDNDDSEDSDDFDSRNRDVTDDDISWSGHKGPMCDARIPPRAPNLSSTLSQLQSIIDTYSTLKADSSIMYIQQFLICLSKSGTMKIADGNVNNTHVVGRNAAVVAEGRVICCHSGHNGWPSTRELVQLKEVIDTSGL